MTTREQALLEKLRQLSVQRQAEVEDFVDFLHEREAERQLVTAAAGLSEAVFEKVWDNPQDEAYDRL